MQVEAFNGHLEVSRLLLEATADNDRPRMMAPCRCPLQRRHPFAHCRSKRALGHLCSARVARRTCCSIDNFIYMYIHTCICVHTYMYICISIHIYIYTYANTCMYHTQVFSPAKFWSTTNSMFETIWTPSALDGYTTTCSVALYP